MLSEYPVWRDELKKLAITAADCSVHRRISYIPYPNHWKLPSAIECRFVVAIYRLGTLRGLAKSNAASKLPFMREFCAVLNDACLYSNNFPSLEPRLLDHNLSFEVSIFPRNEPPYEDVKFYYDDRLIFERSRRNMRK